MKTKVLIIALLILSLLGAFTLKARSQVHTKHLPKQRIMNYYHAIVISGPDTMTLQQFRSTHADTAKQLIADETWLTYTKTGAKITSYSESAFKDISLKFGEQFKSITIRYKSDRHGPCKEYVIYLAQDVANNIKTWAKTNL